MTGKNAEAAWKKAFLMGVGATALTMEKAQSFVTDLVKRGELTQKEATSISQDLKKRALKEKEQLETQVKKAVDVALKNAVKGMGLVTREEHDKLKAELSALKTKNSTNKATASSTASVKKPAAKKPAFKKAAPAKKSAASKKKK